MSPLQVFAEQEPVVASVLPPLAVSLPSTAFPPLPSQFPVPARLPAACAVVVLVWEWRVEVRSFLWLPHLGFHLS